MKKFFLFSLVLFLLTSCDNSVVVSEKDKEWMKEQGYKPLAERVSNSLTKHPNQWEVHANLNEEGFVRIKHVNDSGLEFQYGLENPHPDVCVKPHGICFIKRHLKAPLTAQEVVQIRKAAKLIVDQEIQRVNDLYRTRKLRRTKIFEG